MAFKIVKDKLVIDAARKCGSRTIIAYGYLMKNPNAIKQFPERFSSRGDYMYSIEYERQEYITPVAARNLNYPNIFCIVRNPVDRFISAYTNKIRHYTGNEKLSVEEFINLYDQLDENNGYYLFTGDKKSNKISIYENIKLHVVPLCIEYGYNPALYTNIFNLRQMNAIKKIIEDMVEIELPDLNLNKNKSEEKIALTKDQISWIHERYKKDIEVYGKWM